MTEEENHPKPKQPIRCGFVQNENNKKEKKNNGETPPNVYYSVW